MANIAVNELKHVSIEKQPIEIVERKGVGHPDSICDAMLNDISVALSREYLKRFDTVLHHNIDKGLLVAGETETKFGGGRMKKPMRMVFGDRATFVVELDTVPVNEITLATARKWIKDNLRFVDPERHVEYQIEIKPGSQALRDIFQRKQRILGANDTSAAVGFAPMTKTEKAVYDVEIYLNSKEFKKRYPETGEDIKVMGLRKNGELHLTVAMAFIDRFIDSETSYLRRKAEILGDLKKFADAKIDLRPISLSMNNADREGHSADGLYLTVLGTSADGADCGQVGRGNRVNGIIPLNRPTCSEAAAGKNPVSHVGKIYNLLTYRIAEKIHDRVPAASEVYVWLLSRIGQPINDPQIASVQMILDGSTTLKDVAAPVEEIVRAELNDIDKFCEELAYGKIPVC
jgi:S-adenosylmethionine synthetase